MKKLILLSLFISLSILKAESFITTFDEYFPYRARQTSDSGYVMLSIKDSDESDTLSTFLHKLNKSGQISWGKNIGLLDEVDDTSNFEYTHNQFRDLS